MREKGDTNSLLGEMTDFSSDTGNVSYCNNLPHQKVSNPAKTMRVV